MLRARALLPLALALALAAGASAAPFFRGDATAYSGKNEKDLTGFNACDYGKLDDQWEEYYAAMNEWQFDDDGRTWRGSSCGRCIAARGIEGEVKRGHAIVPVKVKVVDLCPKEYCATYSVDFSAEAFTAITGYSWDRKRVEWEWIDCDANVTDAFKGKPVDNSRAQELADIEQEIVREWTRARFDANTTEPLPGEKFNATLTATLLEARAETESAAAAAAAAAAKAKEEAAERAARLEARRVHRRDTVFASFVALLNAAKAPEPALRVGVLDAQAADAAAVAAAVLVDTQAVLNATATRKQQVFDAAAAMIEAAGGALGEAGAAPATPLPASQRQAKVLSSFASALNAANSPALPDATLEEQRQEIVFQALQAMLQAAAAPPAEEEPVAAALDAAPPTPAELRQQQVFASFEALRNATATPEYKLKKAEARDAAQEAALASFLAMLNAATVPLPDDEPPAAAPEAVPAAVPAAVPVDPAAADPAPSVFNGRRLLLAAASAADAAAAALRSLADRQSVAALPGLVGGRRMLQAL